MQPSHGRNPVPEQVEKPCVLALDLHHGVAAQQRLDQNQQQQRQYKRITWKEPNLAWAIDATQYGRDRSGRKLFVVATTDLASRYCFDPLGTVNPSGEEVAHYLRTLFRQHGPPLFLKRDNGGIFNNQTVDALLARECVIPLNSPAF